MWDWIIGSALFAIVAIAITQYRAQSGTYRSLSSRKPDQKPQTKTPLGMEAIDMASVDKTTRRNEALERSNVGWTRNANIRAAATDIQPWADDAEYAKRYHTAFMTKQGKDA